MCGQRRPNSACTSAQSDQALQCPPTESVDTTESMNGEQMPGQYFAHAQDDLNLRILRMFEGTFLLDAANIVLILFCSNPSGLPAGTWRKYNVTSTSMHRHDVASTLRRRCIYVMCLPGYMAFTLFVGKRVPSKAKRAWVLLHCVNVFTLFALSVINTQSKI